MIEKIIENAALIQARGVTAITLIIGIKFIKLLLLMKKLYLLN